MLFAHMCACTPVSAVEGPGVPALTIPLVASPSSCYLLPLHISFLISEKTATVAKFLRTPYSSPDQQDPLTWRTRGPASPGSQGLQSLQALSSCSQQTAPLSTFPAKSSPYCSACCARAPIPSTPRIPLTMSLHNVRWPNPKINSWPSASSGSPHCPLAFPPRVWAISLPGFHDPACPGH